MSVPTDSPITLKRNEQSVTSIVLGAVSIILALLTLLPNEISYLGFVAPIAALLALRSSRKVLSVDTADAQAKNRRSMVNTWQWWVGWGLSSCWLVVWWFPNFLCRRLSRSIKATNSPSVIQAPGNRWIFRKLELVRNQVNACLLPHRLMEQV